MTARQVDEQGAILHAGELRRTEQVLVIGAAIYVQRNDIGLGQQGIERAIALGIAESQLFSEIEIDDPHPEGLGQNRQLRTDGAITDDA